MNVGADTAQTYIAGIVIPAQTDVIHPPDLWLRINSDIDTDRVQVLKSPIKCDGSQGTIFEFSTGWDINFLGSGYVIIPETSEAEDAVRSCRIAPHRCTIDIEAEATCGAMVVIPNITREPIFPGIRPRLRVGIVDIEVWDELSEERLRRWKVRGWWWWYNSKSVREVELVVRIENWHWLNSVWIGIVAEAQWRDIIKLF
jgi:hypothetical protein